MADVAKLIEDLSGLTVLEAAELARLLKEKWKPPKVSLADIKADIKRDLPLWPDEVIKLWLLYLANRSRGDTGCPPSGFVEIEFLSAAPPLPPKLPATRRQPCVI
jgi:hypothetical protein